MNPMEENMSLVKAYVINPRVNTRNIITVYQHTLSGKHIAYDTTALPCDYNVVIMIRTFSLLLFVRSVNGGGTRVFTEPYSYSCK